MRFIFADCVLDLDHRELRRGSVLVDTEPQVFDVLVFLIRHRDRVVSKDDLVAALWGGRIVSDSTLATRIAAARAAIGDDGRQQRCIRTLSRRGLRFVADVAEVASARSLSGTVARYDLPRHAARLSVLPFAMLDDGWRGAHFARGVFEEILAALSRIPRVELFTVGATDVDYTLTGSIARAGNVVRLLGRLLASDGSVLWAERFEGLAVDTFALQDAFTAGVLSAMLPRIEASETTRSRRTRPESLNAYDLLSAGSRCRSHDDASRQRLGARPAFPGLGDRSGLWRSRRLGRLGANLARGARLGRR